MENEDNEFDEVLDPNAPLEENREKARRMVRERAYEGVEKVLGATQMCALLYAETAELAVDLAGAARDGLKNAIGEEYVPTTEKPIDELDLSVRSYNCLQGDGITHIGDLTEVTPEHLIEISNFGQRQLEDVAEALEEEGLSLATPNYPDDPEKVVHQSIDRLVDEGIDEEAVDVLKSIGVKTFGRLTMMSWGEVKDTLRKHQFGDAGGIAVNIQEFLEEVEGLKFEMSIPELSQLGWKDQPGEGVDDRLLVGVRELIADIEKIDDDVREGLVSDLKEAGYEMVGHLARSSYGELRGVLRHADTHYTNAGMVATHIRSALEEQGVGSDLTQVELHKLGW